MPTNPPPAGGERPSQLIDLALQGGGSHGAFTGGVLDRLLEEPWLRIEAISGTSAGAMNAAVLADGWAKGGAEGARTALDEYWQRVSRAAMLSPLQRSPLDRLMGRWTVDTSQSDRTEYAARDPRREHRFRPSRRLADQAVHHGNERANRPRAHFPQPGYYARRAARVRLPADDVPGDRHRWRCVLGRRICRQSHHHTSDPRK